MFKIGLGIYLQLSSHQVASIIIFIVMLLSRMTSISLVTTLAVTSTTTITSYLLSHLTRVDTPATCHILGSVEGKPRRNISSETKMTDKVIVSYVTAPNEFVARDLSRRLVESRLAACVNIVKTIESIYEWKGKIESDNETLLIIKSHSSKSKELSEFVLKNHPYDCPEVITLDVSSGSEAYLKWVHETISKEPIKLKSDSEQQGQSKET